MNNLFATCVSACETPLTLKELLLCCSSHAERELDDVMIWKGGKKGLVVVIKCRGEANK